MRVHNIRDYSEDKNRRVDDTPYGGGMGMLMAAPPVCECFDEVVAGIPEDHSRLTVYMSPKGKILDHETVKRLSGYDDLIILCGHYEGYDKRISEYVDQEISIGDFVLTGGELPAMVITDSITRLVRGVIRTHIHKLSLLCYKGMVHGTTRQFEQ